MGPRPGTLSCFNSQVGWRRPHPRLYAGVVEFQFPGRLETVNAQLNNKTHGMFQFLR